MILALLASLLETFEAPKGFKKNKKHITKEMIHLKVDKQKVIVSPKQKLKIIVKPRASYPQRLIQDWINKTIS
jgi:hypothetical protein